MMSVTASGADTLVTVVQSVSCSSKLNTKAMKMFLAHAYASESQHGQTNMWMCISSV